MEPSVAQEEQLPHSRSVYSRGRHIRRRLAPSNPSRARPLSSPPPRRRPAAEPHNRRPLAAVHRFLLSNLPTSPLFLAPNRDLHTAAPMEAPAVEPCSARGVGSPTAGARHLHIDGGGSAHGSRRWPRPRISARLPPQIVGPLLGSSCSVVVGAIGRDGAARASPKP